MRIKVLIGMAMLVAATASSAVAVKLFYINPRLQECEQVRNMTIQNIEVARVADGTYTGDFSYDGFTYEVEVAVEARAIRSIRVLKNRTSSERARNAERVLVSVVRKQSLKVDAVTGATTTSKAFLKAVENALKKGVRHASGHTTAAWQPETR